MNHENEGGDIFFRKENDGVNMGREKLEDPKTKRDKRKIRGGLSWWETGRRNCPDTVSRGH